MIVESELRIETIYSKWEIHAIKNLSFIKTAKCLYKYSILPTLLWIDSKS